MVDEPIQYGTSPAPTRKKWICREKPGGGLDLIPIDEYSPPKEAGYYVIDDTIPATWHPATGQHVSSRSEMVKIGKQHGLEQLGNDRIPKKEPKIDRAAIRERLIYECDKRGIR